MKAGYKETPVGVIPGDWEAIPLENCIEVIDGDRGENYPSKDGFSKEGFCLFLTAKNVTKSGFNFEECAFINMKSDNLLRNGKLQRHDIVLTTRGTVGNLAYFNDSIKFENIRINSGMVLLRTNSLDLNASFTYQYLKSNLCGNQINKLAFGSAQPQLTVKEIKKIVIIRPRREEQSKIATTLSTVDEKIDAITDKITATQQLKNGIMQRLLTKGIGHTKFKDSPNGVIPINWELKIVNEFAKVTTGGKDTQNKMDSGAYPFYVRSQTVERIDSYSFDGEAVLTAGDGVGVGKVFHYVNGKFDYHQRVYNIFDFNEKVLGRYFFEYFKKNFILQVNKYNAKGSVDSVRMEMITKMMIPIPPHAEQEKIADIFTCLNEKLEVLQEKKTQYEQLKQGLMQQLLTGKIRVKLN